MPCWRDPHAGLQTGTLLWSVLAVCVWGAPHCSVEMEGTGSSSLGSIEHEALEKGRKSTVGSGSARDRKLEELGWRLGWHSHASGRHLTVCSLCDFQAPMGIGNKYVTGDNSGQGLNV